MFLRAISLQVPCQLDPYYYSGGIALRVNGYKEDGSWIRLQPVQTLLPLSSISVQTSAEAVVRSSAVPGCHIMTELSNASEAAYQMSARTGV